MLAPRHLIAISKTRSPWIATAAGSTVDGSETLRRGVTAIEILLVIAVVACVVLGAQCWCEVQLQMPDPVTTLARSPGEDPSSLYALAISPDETEVSVAGLDGMLRFYNLRTRTCVEEVQNQHGNARSLCYSPDGKQLLVGGDIGHVVQWSSDKNGFSTRSQRPHKFEVSFCLFSPDGRRCVTCGDDRRCIVWDVQTMQPLYDLPGVLSTIRHACFLADGTQLVTADVIGNIQHWDLSKQELIQTLRTATRETLHAGFVVGLAKLPDPSHVLFATRQGDLSIWDLKKNSQRHSFQHNDRELASMSLSRDGRRAVSGRVDGQIEVWNVTTGKCLQTLAVHVGPVKAVRLSDDQHLVISIGWDGQVRFTEI